MKNNFFIAKLIIGVLAFCIWTDSIDANEDVIHTSFTWQKAINDPSFLTLKKQIIVSSKLGPEKLLFTAKQIESNQYLLPLQKELLLEESISLFNHHTETTTVKAWLESMLAYQSVAKVELLDGPHRATTPATSVAANARITLNNWKINSLIQEIITNINLRDYSIKKSSDLALQAYRKALPKLSQAQLVQLIITNKGTSNASHNKILYLAALNANDVKTLNTIHQERVWLSNNQQFVLNELNAVEDPIFNSLLKDLSTIDYFESFSLNKLSNDNLRNHQIETWLLAELLKPSRGFKVAQALQQLPEHIITTNISSEISKGHTDLINKQLLFALKLHPSALAQETLQNILRSKQLSPELKQELATWLK